MSIPWYYVWSPKYEAFHHILMSSLDGYPGFQMNPCFCPQSMFDRKVKEGQHFFAGNPIKFKVILEELKLLEEGTPFILSDADVLVKNAEKFYNICGQMIEKNTITGMFETQGDFKFVNMGLLLCRNTGKVRDYFKFLADTIEKNGIQDQILLNETIQEWVPDYGLFPLEYAIQSNMRELIHNDFGIIQFLCSSNNYEKNAFEKLLSAAYFIDITAVLHLVPLEVQVSLVTFYQRNCPGNPVATFKLAEAETKTE
jgi:hypothetical protein